MYMCIFVCMYVCMYVCTFMMIFTSYAHVCTRTNMHTCIFWSFMTAMLIGTYLHKHAYICMRTYVYTHIIYRTMWWPSWWGRTHVWEQTVLCCCWIPWSLRLLHRSSLLTSGELIYMRVCIYACTCMLLLGPLVAASIARCKHAHASSSRVCMCLCVCN